MQKAAKLMIRRKAKKLVKTLERRSRTAKAKKVLMKSRRMQLEEQATRPRGSLARGMLQMNTGLVQQAGRR